MSNKNKKLTKENFDAKKVEDQKMEQTTPEIPDEKTEGTENNQDSGEDKKDDKKKFSLPKISLPKLKLPSKETVFAWLKGIFVFLLGTVAGAIGIVAAATKIVEAGKIADDSEEEAEETTEEEIPKEELDAWHEYENVEPEPDATEATEA